MRPQSRVVLREPVGPVAQIALVSVQTAALFARAMFLPAKEVQLAVAPTNFGSTGFSGVGVASGTGVLLVVVVFVPNSRIRNM